MARREYGSGTCVRLGRDANGLQVVKLVVDIPGTEPRQRATRRVHCRARDIEGELATFREEVGRRAEGTVSDLLHRWLESRRGKAPKTYARWEGIVRDHLVPSLGNRQVCELEPLEVDDYLAGLETSGRIRKRKGEPDGLSSRTIHHHYSVLCQAFAWGVKKKLIAYRDNPMPAVDSPEVDEAERHAITDSELTALVDAAIGTDLYVPIVLASTTGARRGEILALTWTDVDFDDGLLRISRALTRVKGETSVKEPKSKSSKSTLVLLSAATETLRREQDRQIRRAGNGDGWANLHNLLCPGPDGDHANPESLSAKFCDLRDRLVKAGKLEQPVTFHDLRHYHLTEWQRKAGNVKETQARARHSSSVITVNRYTHASLDEQRRIAAALDGTMGAALRRAGNADGTPMAPLQLVR